VKFLRLKNPQPGRSIGLAFRRTSPRKADFAALGEVVKESMGIAPAPTANRKLGRPVGG
jgi:LysR family hydrogen peroxide-inducible transcriptional activator